VPRAPIGDIEIFYETQGETGTPVLLIMGLSVRGAAWRFQVPDLATRHRVCWFDNRGVGESDVPPGPYSMAQLAGDAAALLDHLGWEDAHIVGVSMGGMIAQHLAVHHRDRVRSLSLLATTPGGPAGRFPPLPGAFHFARVLFARGDARLDAVARLLFPPEARRELDPAWLSEILRDDFGTRQPKAGRRGQLRAVMGHDVRRRLGELAGVPTLVVKPEQDILVRPGESEKLHRGIPGSTILRLPRAGHGLLRNTAGELNPALLDHMARADSARSEARTGQAAAS